MVEVLTVFSAGVAVDRLGGERLLRAGLEALRRRPPLVHAASHRLRGRRPRQVRSRLPGELLPPLIF